MLLGAGARATVHDTVFSYNTAGEGSVAGLLSSRDYVDRIGAVAWFHGCSFINNTESDPSAVAIEDLRGYAYTNTDGLTVWETHCDDEYKSDGEGNTYKYHCELKPYKLAPLSDRQAGRGEDVFAHVTAAAQALPRPSDTAFRQVVGEHISRTGMADIHLLDLPSGIDMALVDGPWDNGLAEWVVPVAMACVCGPPFLIFLCCFCARCWRVALTKAVKTVYNAVVSTVRAAQRCVEACSQWIRHVVTEVKEARAKDAKCSGLTCSAEEVSLDTAVRREGSVSDVADASASPAPIPGRFLQSM